MKNLNIKQLFLKHLAQTSEYPLMLEAESADGIYIYDQSRKSYIDLISGIAVANLGHNHPEIKSAIKKQVDKYTHLMVYGEYIQSIQVEFAKLLTDHLPKMLNTVYFTNSGSEATEGAMKLAKRVTGRKEIIACKNAYHGNTQGAMSLMTGNDYIDQYGPLLPNIKLIEFNNLEHIKQISKSTACIIIEPIQGEAGVVLPQEGYLEALRKRCNQTGTLLIFDEAQTGFGRTGSLFAFEQFGIVPDILLLAKALGGGMPLGAFIASNEMMQSLSNHPALGHITTFGGHPVSCAAGLAHLKLLLKNDKKIIQEVQPKADLFKKLLTSNTIVDLRQKGLMMALELENAEKNHQVIQRCYEEGILTDWFLYADDCLRIAPPLTISEEQIEQVCKTLNAVSS